MRANYIKLDRKGWAQSTLRPSWRPSERTRRGLPWTSAEDKALLRFLAGKPVTLGYNNPTLRAAAERHARSVSSIATRLCALRAGLRMAMTVKER